jgi:hypothetical protein
VAKNVPSSSGGSRPKPFNGTKTPPSGAQLRPIAIYPDTTGDKEARVTLRDDVRTNRVAPAKNVNSPTSSSAAKQVAGTKTGGGARITGGNP